MAWGRQRDQWHHTASLLAMLANVHRDAKKHPRPLPPSQFHPFEGSKRSTGMPVNRETFGAFLAMFVSPEKLAKHQEQWRPRELQEASS